MAGFVQSIIKDMGKGGTMKQLTEAEFGRLIEGYFKQVVNEIEESFLNVSRPLTVEAHEWRLIGVDSCNGDYRECLGRAD